MKRGGKAAEQHVQRPLAEESKVCIKDRKNPDNCSGHKIKGEGE